MDTVSKQQRSRNMHRIKGKDTKPEIILRNALWHDGIRYRKNFKGLPGKPDIAITKYHIAIFVDGEFWHGKDFDESYQKHEGGKYSSLKEQLEHSHNSKFWLDKIQKNMDHDVIINEQLKMMGWTVLRFWSRDVLKSTEACVKVICEAILDAEVSE